MARGGDELAAGVEEPLEVRGHLVERAAELRELARTAVGSARAEIAGRELLGGVAEPVDAPRDRGAEAERGRDGCGRGRGGHREDLHVVAHVEHHPAGQEHGEERDHDGEQREPGELEAHRRQEPERERGGERRGEGGARDGEGEPDHGTNR